MWCSRECDLEYGRQHAWTRASRAALERDGHQCVRCGRRGGDLRPLSALDGRPITRRGQARTRLEVHHKTPVLGQHGVFGCLHHLDGLETLCCDCHLAAHAQLRAAAAGPLPEQLALEAP